MPFDPYSPEDLARLRRAVSESRKAYEPFRENRRVLLKALNDPCHGDELVDTMDRVPHNPLDRALRILTRGVVDQNPSLRIVKSNRPRMAGMLKAQLDMWSRQVNMADILQDLFQEAFLRWGIVYTGFEAPQAGYGKSPFADVIDFDDYFIDAHTSVEDEIDFEGHCWSRRFDEIEADPTNNPEVVKAIKERKSPRFRKTLTTLYDWVDLRCVWLPKEGLELTLVGEFDENYIEKPLRVRKYEGPPPGPYIRLSLGNLRGSMVPVSRASMLYDLHDFIVRAYRHVYAQADRSLEGWGYDKNSENDAEKHRTLRDGEYIGLDNPNGIVRIKKGGVDQQTLASAIHADNLFDTDAGNLKLMGGLGPSAETYGQERGLGVGVMATLDDIRQRMNKVAKKLYEVAAWHILRDPFRRGPVEWTTDNGNTVTSQWSPEIVGPVNPEDPEMEIIPGSMVSRSSEAQVQSLMESFQAIASSMALPGSEPVVFNHRRFRELLAEYRNQPEIAELFSEAPDQNSVAPGVEEAASFAQRPRNGANGKGVGSASPGDRMAERLIFSGGQQSAE